MYSSLKDTYLCTVLALISALDAKDHYTKTHSDNVTRYATAIAQKINLPPADVENIRLACQLHDLGKIGIHDQILTKNGQLTNDEWQEMRQHSLKSTEILKPLAFLSEIITLIEQHHERYDGKGYPYGITGAQIPIGARIIAIADAFDAMTTKRPYRNALSLETAVAEIKKNSGSQFDPELVIVFLQILAENPKITLLEV